MLPSQVDVFSWTDQELMEAIGKRLEYAKVRFEDAFDMTKETMLREIIPILRNGPRDLFAWIGMASELSKYAEG